MEKSAEEYFNEGNELYSQKKYNEAIEKFQRTIEVSPTCAIPFSNIALLQKEMGLYLESKTNWKSAIKKYYEYSKIMYNDFDYYNLTLIYQNIYHDFKEAEEKILAGLEVNPTNPGLLLSIIKLYQDVNRSQLTANDNYAERERSVKERNRAHYKEKEFFNIALKIFEERYPDENDTEHSVFKAKLYKLGGKVYWQKAMEFHEKWMINENNSTEARAGLALLYMDRDKKYYGTARDLMKEAVDLDPDNLDNLSLLAKICIMCGDFENSELYYQRVLNVTDGHMDTFIGLGELYLLSGERLKKNAEDDEAVEKFEAAKKYFEKAKELVEFDYNSNNASRLLFPDEVSVLYYNLGYVNTELAGLDIKKKKNAIKLYKQAFTYFKKVNSESFDYYPAQNAKKKIKKWLKEYSLFGLPFSKNGFGLRSMLWLILLSFQFVFFVGKPTIEAKQYSVNKDFLKSFLSENKIIAIDDSFKINQNEYISMISKRTWPDIENVKITVIDLFKKMGVSEKVLIEINKPELETFLIKEHKFGVSEWKPIDSTLYVTMTFGIFILLIASYYLNDITRIKIGGIELEKPSTPFLPQSVFDIRMGSSISARISADTVLNDNALV